MKKKKLGVIDLGIGKRFEVLSDLERRMVVAGDSWDCTFNAFVS